MGYFICEDRVEPYKQLVPKPMNNKKTPANFATTSALSAVNAIVAVTALTGIASNMISKAQAADNNKAGYSTESQKSLGSNGLEMTTYNSTQTQSFPAPGVEGGYGNDDSHTSTD
jgi:hypothetical protein